MENGKKMKILCSPGFYCFVPSVWRHTVKHCRKKQAPHSKAIHSQDNWSSYHSWSLKFPFPNLSEESCVAICWCLSLFSSLCCVACDCIWKVGLSQICPFKTIKCDFCLRPEASHVSGCEKFTPVRYRSPTLREARAMIHPGSVKYKHAAHTNPCNTHPRAPPPSVITQCELKSTVEATWGLVSRKNTYYVTVIIILKWSVKWRSD